MCGGVDSILQFIDKHVMCAYQLNKHVMCAYLISECYAEVNCLILLVWCS